MIKILKKIAVLFGIIWILILTLWLALSTIILIKKDDIGKYLVSYLNQVQSGELTVEQVSISPLRQFPLISLNLKNVTYYEHKIEKRNESEQPIAKIENFACGLEILKLFKGDFEISKVNVGNGELNFIIYPDSSVNLLNAIKRDSTSRNKVTTELSKNESITRQPSISIEKLTIDGLYLNVTNDTKKRKSSILIKNLDSKFDFKNDKANLNFTSSILVEKLMLNESTSINRQDINLDVSSHLDKQNGLLVEKGTLEISNSKFHFSGHFNPSNDGDLELKIVSDGSLSILSLFVNQNTTKNLNQGDFYLFGFVEGKTFSEFPLINIDFGFKDVQLVNPITSRTIKNLNLKGSFDSGRKKNLSEATLKVDTLYADFPDGKINLAGSVNNFAKPFFNINLFLDADVTGWNEVFKLGDVDSLNGRITIKEKTEGNYDASKKSIISNINLSEISFANFGFIIPGTIRFDKVNGKIFGNGDMFSLKDISIISEGTDLNINGEINNLQYLIFNIEKEIKAQLSIKSSVFDLPNFLAFDPSIKQDFPYRILNVDLLVDATTTTSKVLHFVSFPQINFNIKKLNATAEGFLPPLKIQSGNFNVSEDLLGFHMKFDRFKTGFIGGNLNFSADYNSSSYQPYYIKGEFDMDDIELAKLFYDEKEDSIPEFFKSKLDGSVALELQFASDSNEIKLFNLKNCDISYYFGEDTIQTKSLSFNSEDIDYNLDIKRNPFATLYAKGMLKSKMIKTNYFIIKDGAFIFSAKNGKYEVETKQVKFFGENSRGEGKYFLAPFSEKPSYRIRYNISRFAIKEMLDTFLEDTLFKGNMALSMDVTMHGNDWNSMVRTMDGYVNLSGKNLVMYGVNADKVIKEFQRSQNFNLVDAGAVLLAGPIGLAVSKGSDFARILVTNPGDSSKITNLVSNWSVKNGLLSLEDVAFTTTKNRIAAKGWLNAVTDSLRISFGILNANGCSIFTQDIYGSLDKPTLGKVEVVSALLAPVTNLYNDIVGNDCVVFYNGSVKQPKDE